MLTDIPNRGFISLKTENNTKLICCLLKWDNQSWINNSWQKSRLRRFLGKRTVIPFLHYFFAMFEQQTMSTIKQLFLLGFFEGRTPSPSLSTKMNRKQVESKKGGQEEKTRMFVYVHCNILHCLLQRNRRSTFYTLANVMFFRSFFFEGYYGTVHMIPRCWDAMQNCQSQQSLMFPR